MEKEKTCDEGHTSILDIGSAEGKSFYAIVTLALFLAIAEAETTGESFMATISLVFLILPILVVDSILITKHPVKSLIVITCLIIISGIAFLELWPFERYAGLYIYFAIFCVFVVYVGIFFRLIDDAKAPEANSMKIDSVSELIRRCLEEKSFRMLFFLEFWMLLLGTISLILTTTYVHEEMAGMYEIIFFIVCSVVFSFANLFGMLYITKKIKKSNHAVLLFAAITPIAVPVCIAYHLLFMSISQKLIEAV